MAVKTAIRIGVSGWRYAPWRGRFYPKGLPQRAELEYATRCFSSIEINGSFYSLQSPRSWQAWYEAAPEDFVFGVKGPRYITHMLRLRRVDTRARQFFCVRHFQTAREARPHSLAIAGELRFRCRALGGFPWASAAGSSRCRRTRAQAR